MTYNDGIDKVKKCGEHCQIFSRVVGYFAPVEQFNRSKKDEFYARKKFNVGGALNVIDSVSVEYQLANKVTPESLKQEAVAI